MNYQLKNYINDSFKAQKLLMDFKAKLTNLSLGQAQIEVPITERMHNQHGFAHAGILFSIGDTAAGYAALTYFSVDHDIMTVELKINYLKPPEGKKLRAVGKVIKSGSRLVVVSAIVYSILGDRKRNKKLAVMQGTMIPVNRKNKNPILSQSLPFIVHK
tara:strand:- start:337 stop:813 length:477 start_codon:yes stop_codon:yes gene_type:complete